MKKFKSKSALYCGLLVGAPVLIASVPAKVVFAQQITSEIRGTVTDDSGNVLSNARVTVTDERTSRSRELATNANGAFSARNLATGGPYTIDVVADGFSPQRLKDASISISGDTRLTFALTVLAADSIEEVVVVSKRAVLQQRAIGPNTAFDLATLESFPSIGRDIRDIIRIDPRARIDASNGDAVSCLGVNPRLNAFTVDGVRLADPFGLNSNGFPTEEFPIPFDSIRETSIEFAPYSVEYGQFAGCQINVVTKSGGNEFDGSVFALTNTDSLTGDSAGDQDFPLDDFENYNWGAEFSGALIKDKLFFYLGYEETDDSEVTNFGLGDGSGNTIGGVSQAEISEVQRIATEVFGISQDVVSLAPALEETSRRVTARIDWNISDQHRFAFNYNSTEENFVTTDDGLSFGGEDFPLASNLFNSGNDIEFFSARLFSQWTDNFSTEIQLSRLENDDIQNPLFGGELNDPIPLPQFRIDVESDDDPTSLSGTPTIVFGPGNARSANQLNTEINQVKLKADWAIENHNLTFGYELDQLDVFNLFVFFGTGELSFDSLADFEAGNAFFLGNRPLDGNTDNAAAEFSRDIHSLYVQDEWSVTPALTILGGLRYDFYQSSDNPEENPNFVERYGFSNATAFDDLDLFLPRLGFTYDLAGGNTTVRGGIGIFGGGDPTVWFANAFQNDGQSIGFGIGGVNISGTNGFPPPADIVADQQAEAAEGQADLAAIDPNFEAPSLTRASIGLTHVTDFKGEGFLDNWTVNADLIYSENRDAVNFVDLTQAQVGVLPDGRGLFRGVDLASEGCAASFQSGIGIVGDTSNCGNRDDEILLTNTSEGDSINFSFSANKSFVFGNGGLDLGVGYSFSDVDEVHPGTSSIATSNFGNVATSTFNFFDLPAATGNNETRHNFALNASFYQNFFKDRETRLSVFSQWRSGRRFSYAFNSDVGNDPDGGEIRQLLYIPTGVNDPLVRFGEGFDTAGFFNFIDANGLGGFGGSIIPRNTGRSEDFFDVDIRFSQEIINSNRGGKLTFFMDIENALNLISDSANVLEQVTFGESGFNAAIVDASVDSDTNQFVFNEFQASGAEQNIITEGSLWRIQLGIRYDF